MPEKHPAWTRVRVGRNRVRWIAYDDRVGSESSAVVAQGYAVSLPEADSAARSALASLGMYQARRMSPGIGSSTVADRVKVRRPSQAPSSGRERSREYLYTRRGDGLEGSFVIAAHLVLRKTAKRIYVTRRSFGPDQIGSDDERWDDNEPAIALDRLKLERDKSVYSSGHRLSDFYASREAALGEAEPRGETAGRVLGLRPPYSIDDIKAAFRLKALEAHPDRGGDPVDFLAVEAAYRQLIAEAQTREG